MPFQPVGGVITGAQDSATSKDGFVVPNASATYSGTVSAMVTATLISGTPGQVIALRTLTVQRNQTPGANGTNIGTLSLLDAGTGLPVFTCQLGAAGQLQVDLISVPVSAGSALQLVIQDGGGTQFIDPTYALTLLYRMVTP